MQQAYKLESRQLLDESLTIDKRLFKKANESSLNSCVKPLEPMYDYHIGFDDRDENEKVSSEPIEMA